MRYWECSCGDYQAFGSDAPRLCQVCERCGTTLIRFEGAYVPSEPHDWQPEYSRTIGELIGHRCSKCHHLRKLEGK